MCTVQLADFFNLSVFQTILSHVSGLYATAPGKPTGSLTEEEQKQMGPGRGF